MRGAENMLTDFDQVVERRGTDSHKWNRFASAERDVIAAWVADMDFRSPEPVLEALRRRVDHGVFGYAEPEMELVTVLMDRLERKAGWSIDPSWMVPLSGVVPGLFFATRSVGVAGDGVMTLTPNYHYFLSAPAYSRRELVTVDCRQVERRWELDLDQMKERAGAGVRSFVFCNPCNPVGRILSRAELETIAEICVSNQMMVCSDEIHCDLLLDTDKPHIPIASLDKAIEQNSITLISPSKAFNLPGIGGMAVALIPNPELRHAFTEQAHGVQTHAGALAYHAALAAYRDCDDWLEQLLVYLRSNRDYLQEQIATIDGLSMAHIEATFLAWINVEQLGLENPFEHFHEHGVALSDGREMGDANYLRLNFGCPRATLDEMLQRMRTAVADR